MHHKQLHNRIEYYPSCQRCKPPISFPCHNGIRVPAFPHIRYTFHSDTLADRCEFRSSTALRKWPRRVFRPFDYTALAWWIFRSRSSFVPSLGMGDKVPDGRAGYTNAHRAPPAHKALHKSGPHRYDCIEGSFACHRNNSILLESSSTRSDTRDIANHRPIGSCWPIWSYSSGAGCGSNSDRTKPIELAAPDRNKRDTPTWRNPAPE